MLFAASELIIEFPVAWWLYVMVGAVFAVGLFRRRPPRQQPGRLAVFSVICLVTTVLYLVPWSSRNGFLKRLYSIKPGMTVNEARQIMAGYIDGTGWPANPLVKSREPSGEFTIPGTLVFRHSNDGAYNSDWGIVHIRKGRVIKVEFRLD